MKVKTNFYSNNYVLVIIAVIVIIGILSFVMRSYHQKETFALTSSYCDWPRCSLYGGQCICAYPKSKKSQKSKGKRKY